MANGDCPIVRWFLIRKCNIHVYIYMIYIYIYDIYIYIYVYIYVDKNDGLGHHKKEALGIYKLRLPTNITGGLTLCVSLIHLH